MFLLPQEILTLIYEFDSTFRHKFSEVLNSIESCWCVIVYPCMGLEVRTNTLYSCLTREEAENKVLSCYRNLSALSLPSWVFEASYKNHIGRNMLLCKKYIGNEKR